MFILFALWILNCNMHYIHMCYKSLACESEMASIWNSIVGSSLSCPLHCPLFPYSKVVGCLLSCPLSCQLYPYMEVVSSLICMAKFHGKPTPLPTELPTFSYLEAEGCLLSCPMSPYMDEVGSLICMAKFPWEVHSAAHWAAHFFHILKQWASTELPTELPTFLIYGSSGQPNFHGKN